MTHYEALGVDRNADPVELKEAWRQMARRHHSDAGGSTEADHKKFLRARQAFEVLSDPDRRRRYDEELRRGAEPTEAATPATTEPTPGADLEAFLGHAPTPRQAAGLRMVGRGSELLRMVFPGAEGRRRR